ncbi:MAG: methyltransferase domain-containing protein [Patescibacteria group bacterium]
MKKYFFVLGSNPELSLAELSTLFPENKWQRIASVVFSDFSEELNCTDLMNSLGGTIKIGEYLTDFSLANRHALSEFTKKEIIKNARENNLNGKFNFGFSFYGSRKLPGDFFKLALAVKKDLKNFDISSRIVTSREQILSSVVVEQNGLVDGGLELCFFVDKNKVFIGRTSTVQPFKDLSKRDFGRPNRDDHSGMIPPKLAQIMVNLARGGDADFKEKKILDPFCGSGTILMEAYLMDFKNIIGSDLSDKAINDSISNIDWIIDFNEKKSIESCSKNIDIFQSDVLDLDKSLDKNSIDYIVCEPYLGPQRGFKDFNEVVKELNDLYSGALNVFYKILKTGGRIVMIWPQFRANNKTWKLEPNVSNFKMIPALIFNESNNEEKSQRKNLVYGREDQKVWREIVVLEKK